MFRNIISESEHRFASEHLRKNKHKMSDGKKTAEEQQAILLEVCNVSGKILYCIRKNFIMWDVQSHSITRLSRNDQESGCLQMIWKVRCLLQAAKTKIYNMFCTNNCFKMRT